MRSWLQRLRAVFHHHVWILVIDPPDAPGHVFLQCESCGVRTAGFWRHGRSALDN